jgi:hypothetical protein
VEDGVLGPLFIAPCYQELCTLFKNVDNVEPAVGAAEEKNTARDHRAKHAEDAKISAHTKEIMYSIDCNTGCVVAESHSPDAAVVAVVAAVK